MARKWFGKRFLKITGISFGILLVLLTAFHFWFVAHAKGLLEDLVESQSNGTLKMKVKKFKFSYFSKNMELDKVVFYNTDTLTGTTAYRFSVNKIKLRVNALLPIILKKQFLIGSLTLIDPDIVVTRLRPSPKNDQTENKDISIPGEMGKVYKSIQDAIEVLKVKRFEIQNARFTLLNKMDPTEQPVIITNLFFHLNNLQVDSTQLTGKEKFLFGEDLVLRTRNQNILFPDGRHRLSFSRFRINMSKKLVEFDSCTVAATKTDSSSAAFNVFFDALLMTNIDFDTLYRHEVIKADSVYCVNPRFNLDVVIEKKSAEKKQHPRLDKIIQQLTGNMQLGFVIVNNASFNINTLRNGKPSSFTSDHNNFEVQGLNIDRDAARPLTIKSFAMAIRNYENFLRDSSYSMQFDSILFNNNRIFLSNFSLRQLNHGKSVNNFSMPYFELMGLSWDDLLFDRKLNAKEATLYQPVINYSATENNPRQQKKRDIFQSLASINSLLDLENLDVVNGQINLTFKGGAELHLQNTNMSVLSHSLFQSKKISGLQQSVSSLSFEKGSLKLNDMTAQLGEVHYDGRTENLAAATIQLINNDKSILCLADHVTLNKIVIDDSAKTFLADGIRWKQASLKITIPSNSKKNSASSYSILANKINVDNTKLEATINGKLITGSFQNISADKYAVRPGSKPQIINLAANGKNLKAVDKTSQLIMESFHISDKNNSVFYNTSYSSHTAKDSIAVTIPSLSFVPDIETLINGSVNMDDVKIMQPVVKIQLSKRNGQQGKKEIRLPAIHINDLVIQQPRIYFTQPGKNGTSSIEWNGQASDNNSLQLHDISINGNSSTVSLKKLTVAMDHFLFTEAKGKKFKAGDGKIRAELKNISAEKKADQKWNWSASITDLEAKDFQLDSLGKKSGQLTFSNAALRELNVNSTSVKDIQQLVAANPAFRLSSFNGSFSNAKNYLQWYNAGFDHNSKTLSLDSFTFHPALEQDPFMAGQSFQNDYIKIKTGTISAGPVDLDTYIKDSILNIGTIVMDKVLMTDYRDNRLPFRAGIIKVLPVDLVKKIPGRLSIDTILFNHTRVDYTEVGAKTKEPGTLSLTRMTVKLFPVRNYNLTHTDSLRIQINGHFMDTAWLRLRVRESYTDSLAGFFMTMRMKPADLRILNPVLIPLNSVKVQSGYMDTLAMRVAGKDHLTFGEMKMFYHDLKIKFLKDGSETKKSFLTGLITFVANSFVVRNKNKSRTGTVFFIRNRDRSAVNYLIKIVMSGIASSIGAKSNRKLISKYKKELRQRNLPPFDYD